MADQSFKINEAIVLGYQAPNKESGLTVIAEIYLPSTLQDSNFPNIVLVEVGNSGTYRGEFVPDQAGVWQAIMYKDGGAGQVTKSFSIGSHNVHSVGEAIGTVDSKIDAVDALVDTVVADVANVQTTVDGIASSVGALDTPPMAF